MTARQRGLPGALVLTLTALLTLWLGGCDRPRDRNYEAQLVALGTLVNVVIWDAPPELTEHATSAVTAALNEVHRTWHAWEPSRLTEINRKLAAKQPVTLSDEEFDLLSRAIDLSAKSGHLFDPGIGALIELWGFHSDDRPAGPPPAASAVAELVKRAPSAAALHLVGHRLETDNPAVQLDLGAIAKGYAVNKAVDALIAMGIGNAIVNAGGDLRAIGRHGDRAWKIGIRDPRGMGVLAAVEVAKDESVFTSGDYERYFEYNGQRYHHILDPRTGYPANQLTSATVIHADPVIADAAATALFVAGPRDWPKVAARLGVDQALLVGRDGAIYVTPAMARRVKFEREPKSLNVVEVPS